MNKNHSENEEFTMKDDFIALSNHLLNRLISAPIEKMEEVLMYSLEAAGKFFNVDNVFIVQYKKSIDRWKLSYEWKIPPIDLPMENSNFIVRDTLPWAKNKMLAHEGIKINDTSEICPEAGNDYPTFLASGVRSIVTEPIPGEASTIQGCVGMCTYFQTHTWTLEETFYFEYFSSIVGNILSAMHTNHERSKRDGYILLANELNQITLDATDIESAAQLFAEKIRKVSRTEFCGFTYWNEEQKKTYPIASTGIMKEEFFRLKPLQGSESMTHTVLKNGSILTISKGQRELLLHHGVPFDLPFSTLVVFPLQSESNQIGAMFLGFKNPEDYSEENIYYSTLLSTQVALSINKILLYQKNQRQITEIKTINEISTSLRNAQTLYEIPEVVIRKVIEVCNVDNTALIIKEPNKNEPYFFSGGTSWADLSLTNFLQLYPSFKELFADIYSEQKVDRRNEPLWLELTRDQQSEFFFALPLIAHQQTMGSFCFNSQSAFAEDKKSILSAVADLIANAIYRQSLFDNMQIQLEIMRKMRMQLVQNEKLAAIGELIAGVAHELNNPLTTITLWAELLQQQSISEQERYDLSKIISESRQATSIVQRLLDFSRQHPLERKAVDLNYLLKSTLEIIDFEIKKSNIHFEIQLDSNLPITAADPYQIKQVILNLVKNAMQAVNQREKEGSIKIITEKGATKYFNPLNTPQVIRLIVEDNGAGIPPNQLPSIFDPFFTTKKEGTGLGLSVCHGIITEHGGNIWAESGKKGGTRMFVELPIENPVIEAENETVASSQFTSMKRAKVLIVEDEPAVLEVVQRALMRKGFNVEGVESALEGLKLLENQEYDLIICDIRMPQMNGIEFYQELSKHHPKMLNRIIFTSGDTVSPGNKDFLKLTQVTLLPKPFELEKLISVIQDKLKQIESEIR